MTATGYGCSCSAFLPSQNPQMDLQAQDRCHRIGQLKSVIVYRLITANSVESRILRKARSKLVLERLVVETGGFSRRGTGHTFTNEYTHTSLHVLMCQQGHPRNSYR